MEQNKILKIQSKQNLKASSTDVHKELLQINIQNCESEEWPAIFKKFDKAERLQTLKIINCGPKASTILRHLKPNPYLKHLCLAGNNILSSDIEMLYRFVHLENLDLCKNPDLSSLRMFFQIIQRFKDLKKLCLPINEVKLNLDSDSIPIGDRQIKMIAHNFRKLKYLSLNESNIGAQGARAIGLKLGNLIFLELSNENNGNRVIYEETTSYCLLQNIKIMKEYGQLCDYRFQLLKRYLPKTTIKRFKLVLK